MCNNLVSTLSFVVQTLIAFALAHVRTREPIAIGLKLEGSVFSLM